MFLRSRLLCCNTDENVYPGSDDDDSSGELPAGKRGPDGAMTRWHRDPPEHETYLSQTAGSIRVLPSAARHTEMRRGESDSVAVIQSGSSSKLPAGGGQKDGAEPRALGDTTKGRATSLVSSSCVIVASKRESLPRGEKWLRSRVYVAVEACAQQSPEELSLYGDVKKQPQCSDVVYVRLSCCERMRCLVLFEPRHVSICC